MKKTLVMAALTLLSASAFASKARVNALQSADHISDIQYTFDRPYEAAMHGEFATFEFGTTGSTAEGGFVRQMGDSYLGLYLGHQPSAINTILGNITTNVTSSKTELFGAINPFNVWYASKAGDLTWGVNFAYMSSDKKAAYTTTGGGVVNGRKSSVMGVSGGVTNGAWDASAIVGLAGKAEVSAVSGTTTFGTTPVTLNAGEKAEITAKPTVTLRGGYMMDTMYYYGSYGMSGAKFALAGTDAAEYDLTNIKLGVINTHKKDGTDFFYGVSLAMDTTKEKVSDYKKESMALPVIIGVESEAASWLVFRASMTQNFVLGSTKTTVAGAGGDADSIGPDNKTAAGVGMKWGKFMFDGELASLNSNTFGLDGGNFLTTASFTYLF